MDLKVTITVKENGDSHWDTGDETATVTEIQVMMAIAACERVKAGLICTLGQNSANSGAKAIAEAKKQLRG